MQHIYSAEALFSFLKTRDALMYNKDAAYV